MSRRQPRRSQIAAASPWTAVQVVAISGSPIPGQWVGLVIMAAGVLRVIIALSKWMKKTAHAGEFMNGMTADRATAMASMASG